MHRTIIIGTIAVAILSVVTSQTTEATTTESSQTTEATTIESSQTKLTPQTKEDSQTQGVTETQAQTQQSQAPETQSTIGSRHECPLPKQPIDCVDLYESGVEDSGVYQIWPVNRLIKGPIKVYCDMKTSGGGWTVLLRLSDVLESRNWDENRIGYGDIESDFTLGNDAIFALTQQKENVVRFDLTNSSDAKYVSFVFSRFWVSGEEDDYRVYLGEFCYPTEENPPFRSGSKFSTYDRDNDDEADVHCAAEHKAWWYKKCQEKDLDNLYVGGVPKQYNQDDDRVITRISIRSREFHLKLESCEPYGLI